MHQHQMEKLDATGKDAMLGEDDINFDLQLEKFGIDTSILTEPAVLLDSGKCEDCLQRS